MSEEKAKQREELAAKRAMQKAAELAKKLEEDDYAYLQDPDAMVTNKQEGDVEEDFW